MAKTATKDTTIAEKGVKELQELLDTKLADLLGYKKGLAGGELKNTSIIRETRREIARIKTALAAKEGDK